MAIKWKNMTITKCKTFLKHGGWRILVSIFFGLIAFYFYYIIQDRKYSYTTLETLRLSLLADIFLIPACVLALQAFLEQNARKRPIDASFTYDDWKQSSRKLHHMLFFLFAVLLILSVVSFLNLIETFRRADNWMYTLNYSSGYVRIFAVFITFFPCQITLSRFLAKQLDLIMANTHKANQKVIDDAVKAEKRSVEAAIKSEQLKVDLISNVSHDLKTPLTSMVGYIDLMKKEPLSDTMTDYVDVLSVKAKKLKEMIDSLFSLAKTSSGNIELHPEPLKLNRLVEQIYADMEDAISASDVTFITELTAADTQLITDSSYLYRICQNLVENALKYSACRTRVFLKTKSLPTESGRLIQFEITNTAGYHMNFTKEQIVERFSRGDESRTSEGNGLGLAIVSTYTSALGGRFDIFIDCDQFKAIVAFPIAQDGTIAGKDVS